jgi:hypothetical protein
MVRSVPLPPDAVRGKTGRFSREELAYIKENITAIGLAGTAKALNRDPETVKKYALQAGIRFDNVTEEKALQVQISQELEQSPEWDLLKEEFSDKELSYFQFRYAKLMAQFKNDVFASEETQIHQLIKFEILMNRNLRSTKKAVAQMRQLEARIAEIHTAKADGDELDITTKNLLNTLENQLLSLRNSQGSKSVEFVRLQEKHANIMKDLKATREQRMTRIENSKSSIITLLKEFREKEFQELTGKQMVITEAALRKETQRLGSLHKYEDGNMDRPVLSVDTLDISGKEESDEEQ